AARRCQAGPPAPPVLPRARRARGRDPRGNIVYPRPDGEGGAARGPVDRRLVLKRFVHGAEGEAFYQKRAPEQRPAWLRTVTLSFPSGRTAEEVVIDDAAGLART